jgi:hypothetical protein
MRRRKSGRRAGETRDIYVDAFQTSEVILLIGIFVLNIFDALFTLIWLQRGGAEANPFMDWLIQQGDHVFLVQKCIVVGLWLVFLLVHKNFRLARWGMWSMAGVYGVLILYHFALMASGLDPMTGRKPGEAAAISERISVSPITYAKDLEESGEQRRERGLDAQDPLAEVDGRESGGGESIELMLAPSALRTDRQSDGPLDGARALDGAAGIGHEPPRPVGEAG